MKPLIPLAPSAPTAALPDPLRPADAGRLAPPSGRVALGRWGENLAVEFVTDLGWTVLDRNWRCARGEIDLVGLDSDVLVMCEVKTRSSARCGTAIDAVHPRKIARLRVLCGLWLEAHKHAALHFSEVRLDVVAVTVSRSGVDIEHVAWVG